MGYYTVRFLNGNLENLFVYRVEGGCFTGEPTAYCVVGDKRVLLVPDLNNRGWFVEAIFPKTI